MFAVSLTAEWAGLGRRPGRPAASPPRLEAALPSSSASSWPGPPHRLQLVAGRRGRLRLPVLLLLPRQRRPQGARPSPPSLLRIVTESHRRPAGRLVFALDDTPTKRYGPQVQGAGIHHNPTPGPAGSQYLYGHVWVVLSRVAHHARWGAIALPLLARLYVRKKDLPELPRSAAGIAFRTKLELAAETGQLAPARRLPGRCRAALGGGRRRLRQEGVPQAGDAGRLRRGRPAPQGRGPVDLPPVLPPGQSGAGAGRRPTARTG